ncbi:MAG: hypothetical protein M3P18_06935 [Actinomycetota bacterium]|nr:hypothetical protein [Actinomycetota bacterium]
MTKKHDRDRLPNPSRLEYELDELLTLLLEHRAEIVSAYRWNLDLGLDPRQGTDGASVHSGLSNYVPEVAVGDLKHKGRDGKPRSAPGERDREHAASLYDRVEWARKVIGNVVKDANRGRERQPAYPRRGAFIDPEDLEFSVEALQRREAGG